MKENNSKKEYWFINIYGLPEHRIVGKNSHGDMAKFDKQNLDKGNWYPTKEAALKSKNN